MALNIRETFNKKFNETYGSVPTKDSDLRSYIESVKEKHWLTFVNLSNDISELKAEVDFLNEQLNTSKSDRERELEQHLKIKTEAYNRITSALNKLVETEQLNYDKDLTTETFE